MSFYILIFTNPPTLMETDGVTTLFDSVAQAEEAAKHNMACQDAGYVVLEFM